MLIDWFTVVAQFVNFLILVYLLKRFLYTPILNAIDERERRIASQLEDAARLQMDAREEQQRYRQMNEALDQKKETLLHEAQDNAAAEHKRLLEEARREYAGLRKNLKEKLEAEQSNLNHEFRRRTQEEVFDIARKVLADLAGTSLESQIMNVFLKKLNALKQDEIEQLRGGLKQIDEPLTVSSAFELSPEQKAAAEDAVKKLLGSDTPVRFRVAPHEMSGIELSADGYKVAWTITEYLDSLEKRIAALADGMHGSRPDSTIAKNEN